MTVTLAGIDKKTGRAWIGSDSCASDSISHSTVNNNKVFHPVGRRDILIGCAGTFRMPNLLQYIPGIFPDEEDIATDDIDMSYLVNEFTPVIRAITDDFDEDDAWELLIAVGDRLYHMQMDLSIIEPADDADAIGIGGSVALGAFRVLNELVPDRPIEDRISHALQVACDSCQGCRGPFKIMQTEPLPEDIVAKAKENVKNLERRGYCLERHDDLVIVDDDDSNSLSRKKKKDKKHKRHR